MSRTQSNDGDARSLPTADEVTVTDALGGDLLDFQAERDRDSTSWDRADGLAALIERASHPGWLVTLPDSSDAHTCALATTDETYLGWCDCKGFQYHDGPCAHLCTLRKAEFVGAKTTDGTTVSIARAETEQERQAATDGGVDRARRADRQAGRLGGGRR